MAKLTLKNKNNKIIVDPDFKPVEITPIVVEPPVITDAQLKEFIKNTCPFTATDVANYKNDIYRTSDFYYNYGALKSFLASGCFANCCGVVERSLNSVNHIINKPNNTYTFGRLLYYVFGQAWKFKDPYDNTYKTNFTVIPVLDNLLLGFSLCAGYVYTWASHQDPKYKDSLLKLGATIHHVGLNPKYPAGSNHFIDILIIDLVNSIDNFINNNRDQLIKDYMAQQS